MGSRPRLSTEKRWKVIALHKTGMSCNEIARNLRASRSAVQGIVRKHRETASVLDRPGRGRKKMTTSREDRLLIRAALANRKATAAQLVEVVHKSSGKRLSCTTVKARLTKVGLKSRRAARKPLLTKKNRLKRLALPERIVTGPAMTGGR